MGLLVRVATNKSDPIHFSSLLRLDGERRGEGADGKDRDETDRPEPHGRVLWHARGRKAISAQGRVSLALQPVRRRGGARVSDPCRLDQIGRTRREPPARIIVGMGDTVTGDASYSYIFLY